MVGTLSSFFSLNQPSILNNLSLSVHSGPQLSVQPDGAPLPTFRWRWLKFQFALLYYVLDYHNCSSNAYGKYIWIFSFPKQPSMLTHSVSPYTWPINPLHDWPTLLYLFFNDDHLFLNHPVLTILRYRSTRSLPLTEPQPPRQLVLPHCKPPSTCLIRHPSFPNAIYGK